MTEELRSSYQVLRVSPLASVDEIKHAYWRQAKLWCPDPEDGDIVDVEKMIELNRARELLLNTP